MDSTCLCDREWSAFSFILMRIRARTGSSSGDWDERLGTTAVVGSRSYSNERQSVSEIGTPVSLSSPS